ncbi:aminotransferase class I/II-fold pyridoxal phosphate-dependent enzyme [cyanobacterium endosymbiont of Epithemia turgida]|uniref:aminotransferase class I/II-fold pyridoxal phosphate-dependent enzyme n=1 Tax=cyanobacterium endosymbiont of Epithemia turgida TaxID=718217 RepID=UPI0011AEA963
MFDEAYEYCTYNKVKYFSLGQLFSGKPNTIFLYSLSKIYGFSGLCIGYILIFKRLLAGVKKLSTQF